MPKHKPKPKPKRARADRGIVCPDCQSPAELVYTRSGPTCTLRRKQCRKCKARFTTAERISGRTGDEKYIPATRATIAATDFARALGIPTSILTPPVILPQEDHADEAARDR